MSSVLRMIRFGSQTLTAEDFTLQGARNGTISEPNGRFGHYLSAVGSGVVALAFVADVSDLGPVFLAFSAVIFPVLIFLGVATYVRLIQIGIADTHLAQAINRVRHCYLEVAPEPGNYFSFPQHDEPDAVGKTMRPFHFPLQGFASTPGPVSLINNVLTGAFASILATGQLSVTLSPIIVIGLSVPVLALVLQWLYGKRVWQRETKDHLEIRFPTPEE